MLDVVTESAESDMYNYITAFNQKRFFCMCNWIHLDYTVRVSHGKNIRRPDLSGKNNF